MMRCSLTVVWPESQIGFLVSSDMKPNHLPVLRKLAKSGDRTTWRGRRADKAETVAARISLVHRLLAKVQRSQLAQDCGDCLW